MIRVVIVDDEPLSRRAVRQLCERYSDVVVIAECEHGVEAVSLLRRASADLVFLDVKMPGLSGLAVARRLDGSALPLFVFVTAYQEFALPAFDVDAVDYLTKPLNAARFDVMLQRIRTQLALLAAAPVPARPRPTFVRDILARARGRDILLATETIEFIAADDVYAAIRSQGGTHLVRQTLDSLQTQLDPSVFVRVHRSYIVHIDYVASVRRSPHGVRIVVMKSGTEIPVSRRRKRDFERLLSARVGVTRA